MQITFEAVAYSGDTFKHDEDGNATTAEGKALETLGFTQREIVHPKYDHELVLDHGSLGRMNPGQVVVVHEDNALAIIDGKKVKPKKAPAKATKKATKK